jgi:hypothetical protein
LPAFAEKLNAVARVGHLAVSGGEAAGDALTWSPQVRWKHGATAAFLSLVVDA